MRWIVVLFILISAPLAVAEEYPEDPNYVSSQSDLTWPISSQDITLDSGLETSWWYPAMEEVDNAEIANNGPFPILLWFPDEDESMHEYSWLSELAKSGNIIVTTEYFETENDSDSAQFTKSIWTEFNSLNSDTGIFSNAMDVEHWAIGGHGYGAATAATALSSWDGLSFSPPRGLVGLGLDTSNIQGAQREVDISPNTALFLTGTVDDLAPASEHITPFVEQWSGGWQIMHVTGANHVQYQTESGIVENFLDGDPTMSREEQQEHALTHILPYLNLTLRGEHEHFIKAFNREVDTVIPSDVNAHIVEDLSNSRLIHVNSLNSPPGPLDYDDTFEFRAQATHRDGTEIQSYQTICEVGSTIVSGENMSCSVPMSDLTPGEHAIRMSINAQGMIGYQEVNFTRSNTDLELAEPLPVIRFDQNTSGNVTIDELVSDPDGSEIWFESASLLGENERLRVSLSNSEIVVEHYNESEWNGEVLLNVWLKTQQDNKNVSLRVIVDPVDNRVVLIAPVPRIELLEDGQNGLINLAEYVQDPESSSLAISFSQSVEGLDLFTNGSIVEIVQQKDYSGASVFEIQVSDGTTDPIAVEITVVVESIPDPMVLNQSTWQISLDEDGALSLPLSAFGMDPDGEDITYNLSQIGPVPIQVSGTHLLITPPVDWNGVDESVWLNLSSPDSQYSEKLRIEVNPVNDAPHISIIVAAVDEMTITADWTVSDADSEGMPLTSFLLDGFVLDAVISCSTTGTEWSCHALFEVPANHSGGSSSFSIIVDDGNYSDSDSRQLLINIPLGDDVSEESSFVADNIVVIVMVALVLAFIGLLLVRGRPPEAVVHEVEEQKYGLLARAEMV